MMEALGYSETRLLTRATRRNNPEDGILPTLLLQSGLLVAKLTTVNDGTINECGKASAMRIGRGNGAITMKPA
jgi:hypothetical protein